MDELGISFDDDLKEDFISKISNENKSKLYDLMLNRLRELDTYQWKYYEELVKMIGSFSSLEYETAKKLYIESYQESYSNISISELLYMCKKWDSTAYVFRVN